MRSYTIIVSIIATLASACAISCASQGDKQPQATTDEMVNHIEVIYFHGNMRCITCKAIEKYARETVDSIFPDEKESGRVIFRTVNITDNEEMADNYQASGSSLFVTSLADGHESRKDLTEYGFRTARRHHEMFQDSLASAIRQSLENLKP